MKEKIASIDLISESCLKFLVPMTSEKIYKSIVDEARKLVDADAGSVYIKGSSSWKKVYASHRILYNIQTRPAGTVQKVFESRKAFIHTDSLIAKSHPEYVMLGFKSFIIVPLSYGGETMGVLCLQSKKSHNFSPEKTRILTFFCSMAFLSIRKTQLYMEAMSALQTRDLFIAMASHELKTPLTSIHLYLDLLNKHFANSSDARYVEALSTEVFRLTTFVKDLLQVDLIKKGKLPYRWKEFSAESVIEQAITTFKQTHPFSIIYYKNLASGIALVKGDFNKLLQVVINLLTNAAKYSEKTSPIMLSLQQKDNAVVISVEDHGRGIPKKDIPKIFNQYYKAKNSVNEGMGLGLYIIKNIVNQHSGEIYVESVINKGTKVIVILPKL